MKRSTSTRWWLESEESALAGTVGRVAAAIWDQHSGRRAEWLTCERLYGSQAISALGRTGFSPRTTKRMGGGQAWNVIKACCDAYVAKITKDKVKVQPVPTGGDHAIQKQAKQLDKALEGLFYESRLYAKARRLAYIKTIYGTAFVKIATDGEGKTERPDVDVVFPWEVLVDDQEARHGEPRNWYQRSTWDREKLQQLFPDKADEIEIASSTQGLQDDEEDLSTADELIVIEAWHTSRGHEVKRKGGNKYPDGRHVIVCGGLVLHDEEWARESPPLEALVRVPPIAGIYGVGLPTELKYIQLDINQTMETVQLSQRMSVGHWFIDTASNVNFGKIDNFPGSGIRFSGVKPVYEVFPSVHPEYYQHLDRQYGKCFELSAVSQLSAQGLKPAGLDSGEAQRVYLDTQTERFKVCFEEYQDFFLRVGRQLVQVAGEVADRNKSFAVKVVSGKKGDRIILSDVWMDANDYVLKLYPTAAFSTEPAARIAEVSKLVDSGLLSPEDGQRLLELPDLEGFNSLKNASYDLVMDIIDSIKSGDEYIGPEPFMNLIEAVKWVQLSYLKGRLGEKVPQENLDKLITWIQTAQDIMAANAAPAGPAPAGDPGAPMPPPDAPMPPGPPGLPPGPPMPPPEAGGTPQGIAA